MFEEIVIFKKFRYRKLVFCDNNIYYILVYEKKYGRKLLNFVYDRLNLMLCYVMIYFFYYVKKLLFEINNIIK